MPIDYVSSKRKEEAMLTPQEHEVLIEHTAEERLIYRQACHDRGSSVALAR